MNQMSVQVQVRNYYVLINFSHPPNGRVKYHIYQATVFDIKASLRYLYKLVSDQHSTINIQSSVFMLVYTVHVLVENISLHKL